MPHVTAPHVVALGEVLWDLFPDSARFGGAPANFAHHVAALGARVSMVTAVGGDDLGRDAIERLGHSGIDLQHVAVLNQYPTGRVNVALNEKGEASYRFGLDEAWDHLQWTDSLEMLAAKCDAVCFGTLGQRHADSRGVIEQFVRSTRPESIRMLDVNLRPPFVDPAVIASSLELANVVKLNEAELEAIGQHWSTPKSSHEEKIARLASEFPLHAIAVTLGEHGAILFRGGEICRVEAKPVLLADTVGAGDAFAAVFVLGLLAEAKLNEIAEAACRVAEFVCSQPGATPKLSDAVVPRHFLPALLRPSRFLFDENGVDRRY